MVALTAFGPSLIHSRLPSSRCRDHPPNARTHPFLRAPMDLPQHDTTPTFLHSFDSEICADQSEYIHVCFLLVRKIFLPGRIPLPLMGQLFGHGDARGFQYIHVAGQSIHPQLIKFTQHGSSISNSWLYIQSSLFRLFTVVCVKDLARQPTLEIRAESPSRIYVDAQVVHCSEIILAMLPHSLAIVMHQRTRCARLHRH